MHSHNILSVKKNNKKTMASGPTKKALRSWCAVRASVSIELCLPWVGGKVAVDESAVCAREKRRKGKKGREREGEKGREGGGERETGRERDGAREFTVEHVNYVCGMTYICVT